MADNIVAATHHVASDASIEPDTLFSPLCGLASFVTNSSEILTITHKLSPAEVFVLCSLLTSQAEIPRLTLRERLPPDTCAQLGSAISASSTIYALTLEKADAFGTTSASELFRKLAAASLEQLSISDLPLYGNKCGYDPFGKLPALRSLTIQSGLEYRCTLPQLVAWTGQLRVLESLDIDRISLTDSGAGMLVVALKSLPMLVDLSIRKANLKVGRPIGDLVALGKLRKLDLNGNLIGNSGVSEMVDAILPPEKHSARCKLQTLRLSANEIDRDGARKLTELIRRSPHLRTLDLSDNYLYEIFCPLSEAVLLLEEVDVSDCHLCLYDIVSMMRATSLPALRILRINGNSMGKSEAQAIALFITSSGFRTLTELSLRCCFDVSPKALANAFAEAYRLHTIDMANNRISTEDVAGILDGLAIAYMTPMDTICFKGCHIEDLGAEAAGRLIARRGCKHLILDINWIHVTGAKAIADSVAISACVIQDLDLSNNPIGDAGVKYLLDKIVSISLPLQKQQQSRHVRELRIADIRMGVEGALAIKRVMEAHDAIRQLSVSRRTGDKQADNIIKGMERGSKSAAAGATILTLL